MATILIGTEVPEGMGHVAPWLDFCQLAIVQKNTVHMAGPDLLVLQRCIASRAEVKIWAAPRVNPVRVQQPTRSWPELLVSLGYAEPEWLMGAVLSWASILDAAKPDVVLTDYAPALMLACHELGVRYLEVGGGFCVPPVNPDGSMPPFPGILSADMAAARGSRSALERLSQAMTQASQALGPSNGATAPREWASLHVGSHRRLVTSIAALDHYDERDHRIAPVEHIGFLGLGATSPHEAALEGSRRDEMGSHLVAYLKSDTPKLDDIVSAISSIGVPAQIYCPGLGKPVSCDLVKFAERPLDLGRILDGNSQFVTNGGLASTGLALHRGAAVWLVPQHAEQIAMARRLTRTGLGGLFWANNLKTQTNFKHLSLVPIPPTEELMLELINAGIAASWRKPDLLTL